MTFRTLTERFATSIPLMVLSSTIQAVTFNVDNTDDPFPAGACSDEVENDCSLREAISQANNTPGGDIIMIPAGTYTLTRVGAGEDAGSTGDLDIFESAFLQGAGKDLTIIDATGLGDRVFNIFSADGSEFHDMTIKGGLVSVDEGGGGLAVHSHIVLDHLKVTANEALFGGGIFNAAAKVMIIRNSDIHMNHARHRGGGIVNEGTLTVTDSVISENTSVAYGGGFNSSGSLTIQSSFVTINTSNQGGGIDNSGGAFNVFDSSITGNKADQKSATGFGGGGILHFAGTADIQRTVISDNQAIATTGGGIWNNANMTIEETTIDANTSTVDGAALFQQAGTLIAESSTISNHSGGSNSIIHTENGNLSLLNTTVSGNSTTTGAIIYSSSGGIFTEQMTFYDNDASLVNEIFAVGSTFLNSILQGSCGGIGDYLSNGGNVIGPGFGCGITQPTDLSSVTDMKLGPLQDNGGLTKTHLPQEGSPVIDRILSNTCYTFSEDQRGLPRQVDLLANDEVCDSGAVEVQPVMLPNEIFINGFEPTF